MDEFNPNFGEKEFESQFRDWLDELALNGDIDHYIQDFLMLAKMRHIIDYAVMWIAGTRFNGAIDLAKKFLRDEKISNILEFAYTYITVSPFECDEFIDYMKEEFRWYQSLY